MSDFDEIAGYAARYLRACRRQELLGHVAGVEVVQRRLELAGCMQAAGWTPSPELLEELARDRLLLELLQTEQEQVDRHG